VLIETKHGRAVFEIAQVEQAEHRAIFAGQTRAR
jgi:hypothetical protein